MPTKISGQGNSFNLPNYSGDLFTTDAEVTPFLSMAGGLTGGKLSGLNIAEQSNNVVSEKDFQIARALT